MKAKAQQDLVQRLLDDSEDEFMPTLVDDDARTRGLLKQQAEAQQDCQMQILRMGKKPTRGGNGEQLSYK